MPASESAAAPSAVALLRDRRVITVIGVTAIAGGSLTALAVKRQAAAKRCVKRLNSSLSAYLVAARDGELDEQAISRLIEDLDDARRYSDNGQVAVAEAVVELVVDYTARLAEANSIDLAELEQQAAASQVVDLRPYLELQRRIVTGAA